MSIFEWFVLVPQLLFSSTEARIAWPIALSVLAYFLFKRSNSAGWITTIVTVVIQQVLCWWYTTPLGPHLIIN